VNRTRRRRHTAVLDAGQEVVEVTQLHAIH
jgi:hypothetical protein